MFDAPPVQVVVGRETHTTIFVALRMLGLGSERVKRVPVEGQGRMLPDELRRVLDGSTGPAIVCAQAGNVNTGAFDPLREIAAATAERGPGSTWTAPSGCGPRHRRTWPITSTGSRGPSRGPRTPTSG